MKIISTPQGSGSPKILMDYLRRLPGHYNIVVLCPDVQFKDALNYYNMKPTKITVFSVEDLEGVNLSDHGNYLVIHCVDLVVAKLVNFNTPVDLSTLTFDA